MTYLKSDPRHISQGSRLNTPVAERRPELSGQVGQILALGNRAFRRGLVGTLDILIAVRGRSRTRVAAAAGEVAADWLVRGVRALRTPGPSGPICNRDEVGDA